jgi:aryl-alcohol dehydrogenase-like predicted oxidoreductase
MHLSIPGRPERARAIEVVQRAVELGVTLIDTADAYALDDTEHGHNETLVVEALRGMGIDPHDTEAPVVATKGGRSRPGGKWALDAHPDRLRDACHASLRRMGLERIPLYQLHQPDDSVPFADSVGALARLAEEGTIEAVGLSNVSAKQLAEADAIVPIASVQNSFSPWDTGGRKPEILERCEEGGRVFMAYGPLGGRDRAPTLTESDALAAIGRRLDASPQELVLAWLLAYSPLIVPIPGARRVASVESSARAASLALAAEDLDAVGRALGSLPGRPGLARRVAGRAAALFRRVLD